MSRRSTRQAASGLPAGVRLFGWVRLRIWRTHLRELLRMPAKLVVVVLAWAVLLGGVYELSYRGLRLIYETAGLGPFLLSRLWCLFLFVILTMLAVSQLASAYSTLVRAPETRWWMVLPVSARTLCRVKWLESSCYSAWAVVLLVLPVWLAYLRLVQQPWWLAGWAIAGILTPLLGLVTAVATIGLLIWLRWLGRFVIRRELIPLGFVLACGLLFWLLGEQRQGTTQDAWFVVLQALLPRMHIAMSMWLPSSWAATALEAGLHGRWVESGLFTLLLWMTMLVCWRALDHVAAGLLLPVLRQQSAEGAARTGRVASSTGSIAIPLRLEWWTRHPFVGALLKDALVVIRDPMQWSQGVVFFGLLGAYFANMHRLAHISLEPSWRVGVASLHLACTLLVFGSLAVRFIFPQPSLESRSLWLLRMAPHGMRRLLASKLCLYGILAVGVIEGLMALSLRHLGVPPVIRWWLAGVGVIAALTIVGMTVGWGAWWMDPGAQDAARVVSSSNGALVLVFVLGYVGCVIAALEVAWTSWVSAHPVGLVLASLALLAVSVCLSAWPVRRGFARLERLEWAS